MILGASFILTLNISISNFCKLAWTLKEPSFARSYQTLNYGLDIQFMNMIYVVI